MANTYTNLIYHFVWSTKDRIPMIARQHEERIWAFIAGIARQNKMHAIRIGGVEDHVHALLQLPKTITVSAAMQRLKGGASVWINEEKFCRGPFRWQDGFGAFTVSCSQVPHVTDYIANQRDHHAKTTFKEEYVALLAKHGVDYEERYLWN